MGRKILATGPNGGPVLPGFLEGDPDCDLTARGDDRPTSYGICDVPRSPGLAARLRPQNRLQTLPKCWPVGRALMASPAASKAKSRSSTGGSVRWISIARTISSNVSRLPTVTP
jgi:hypothetical protein